MGRQPLKRPTADTAYDRCLLAAGLDPILGLFRRRRGLPRSGYRQRLLRHRLWLLTSRLDPLLDHGDALDVIALLQGVC